MKGIILRKMRIIYLTIFMLLIFSTVGLASNIESVLEEMAVNEPDKDVVVVLVLDTNNEGLLDEIKEATKDIDDKASLIMEENKEKFRKLKEELGYSENKEEILRLFKENDAEFMNKFKSLEEKYGLSEDQRKKSNEILDKLKTKRNKSKK